MSKQLSLIMMAYLLLALNGCKESDDPPVDDGPYPIHGVYNGLAQIGGQWKNIQLEIAGDSAASSGSIFYLGESVSLSNIYTDTSGDSLWFNYMRGSQLYRVWAGVFSTGLDLHYLEPSGFPSISVNRLWSGYNLSGFWSGPFTNGSENTTAEFFADQRGSEYQATLSADFLFPISCAFDRGSASGSDFVLNGTGEMGGASFVVTVNGHYAHSNRIEGTWQANGNGYSDNGSFVMERSFN